MRNKLFLSAIIATASLSISGCAVHVSAHGKHKYEDLDSVFGGVTVGKGALVRDVSSVNGGVELASNSSARDVDTVNGGIDISDDVKIRSAETVNGGIDGGRNLSVEKSVVTVNGGIELGEGSTVGTDVKTVNGDIDLSNVTVSRHIKTNNGDITLLNGTNIQGDIIIEASNGWFSGWGDSEKVVIKIDDSSSVLGNIHLYKPVKLEISDKAKVGEVQYHYDRK